MDITSPHILMTAGNAVQDLVLQKLLEPYSLHLSFCPFDAGELIDQLQRREYDAVVIRCSDSDLSCTALLSRYNLLCSTGSSPFFRRPAVPFLAILPGADAVRRQTLLNSGYAEVLCQPLSEYTLAQHLTEHIRLRHETLALRESTLYDCFSELLLELGCPAHLHGFHYLCCCLVYLTDDPDALHQLTQVLYPCVAAQLNTSAGNLERSIRTALDHIEKYGNRQLLCELLPSCLFRPQNRRRSFRSSELLTALLRHNARLQRLG